MDIVELMIHFHDAVVAAVVGGPLGEVVIRRRRAGLRITGVEKVIEVEAERVGLHVVLRQVRFALGNPCIVDDGVGQCRIDLCDLDLAGKEEECVILPDGAT